MALSVVTPADLLLYNAHVLTLDPQRPYGGAVAIASGHIVAAGSEGELRPFVSSRTQLLSCSGHTVLPGFIDPHVHLFAWASRFCGVDVSVAHSITDIQELLTQRARGVPVGEWVRGYGYDEFFLAEKRPPTRQDLDIVSTRHPLLLRHRTGHAAVLNSFALRLAGIDRNFVASAGEQVEREPNGDPTGVTYELESFLRTVVPPLAQDEFASGLKLVAQELLCQGVTSFHDASAGNTLEDLALFRWLHAEGVLASRATIMIGIAALPQVVDAGLPPFSGNDAVRLGSVKIMVHESRGKLSPSPEELTAMVWQAHRLGWQVAIHAVEEGPICIALDAIARAQVRLPRQDHRYRLEHCALCPPPLIDALAEVGGVVVTQPGFLHFHGEKYAAEVDPERRDWLYRAKSLLRQGVTVVGSSDCPIAPLAPLVSISTAMTRRSRRGDVFNKEERLSLEEAVSLFTAAGAWVGFEETKKGKILPGMLADLIVLDGDLTRTPPEEIGGLKVETTIIGGRVVWTARN